MAKTETNTSQKTEIELRKIELRYLSVVLKGDSSLIMHKWSHKARQQMLDKQMKKAKGAKVPKDPDEDYVEAMYLLPNGDFGFPSIAFKSAVVDACSYVDGLTKVIARGAFHIDCEMVRIYGTPQKREDMVRVGMGTADIRHRPEFVDWYTHIPVKYNANVLSETQIYSLFEIAGFSIGIGDWRPQKDGQNGRFHVCTAQEIEKLNFD